MTAGSARSTKQTGQQPVDCPQCVPQPEIQAESHLTKLDRDILDDLLEIATCHLDDDGHDYILTVGMIARCLAKTEGQLTASFKRLIDNGLLVISAKIKPDEALPPRCSVLPSAKALRTLEYYSGYDDPRIDAELSKLMLD